MMAPFRSAEESAQHRGKSGADGAPTRITAELWSVNLPGTRSRQARRYRRHAWPPDHRHSGYRESGFRDEERNRVPAIPQGTPCRCASDRTLF